MKTRTWIIIFALILIASLGASFYFLMPGEASDYAEITSHGQVIKTVDLRIDQEFTVENGNDGYNVITVQDGKIGVSVSPKEKQGMIPCTPVPEAVIPFN